MSERGDKFFDDNAERWERLGKALHRRPVQFIMYVVGLLAIILVLGGLFERTNTNSESIQTVKTALCKPPANSGDTAKIEDPTSIRQCQELFNRLLEHPTQAQIDRLRQLVKKGP